MPIVVETLTEPYLERTCAVVDACFPHEPVHPDLTVRESLDKCHHLRQSILKEYGEPLDRIDFWIALDTDNDRVVGTSGLYYDMRDEDEAVWMEWFCVDPEYRGRGIGVALIDKAISEALRRGKAFLRLYTNEEATPTVAHAMYAERGFRVMHKEWDARRGCNLLFMEKRL